MWPARLATIGRLLARIDLRDLHIYGGLAVAAVGAWQLSPAWTCIALGLVLTALGVVGPYIGRAHREE